MFKADTLRLDNLPEFLFGENWLSPQQWWMIYALFLGMEVLLKFLTFTSLCKLVSSLTGLRQPGLRFHGGCFPITSRRQVLSRHRGPLALTFFPPSLPHFSLHPGCSGCFADTSVEVGHPSLLILWALTSCVSLQQSPSIAERSIFDEQWELHLPVGVRILLRPQLGITSL